jgi:hypothetical protein
MAWASKALTAAMLDSKATKPMSNRVIFVFIYFHSFFGYSFCFYEVAVSGPASHRTRWLYGTKHGSVISAAPGVPNPTI